jgi:hypothetical protein
MLLLGLVVLLVVLFFSGNMSGIGSIGILS